MATLIKKHLIGVAHVHYHHEGEHGSVQADWFQFGLYAAPHTYSPGGGQWKSKGLDLSLLSFHTSHEATAQRPMAKWLVPQRFSPAPCHSYALFTPAQTLSDAAFFVMNLVFLAKIASQKIYQTAFASSLQSWIQQQLYYGKIQTIKQSPRFWCFTAYEVPFRIMHAVWFSLVRENKEYLWLLIRPNYW